MPNLTFLFVSAILLLSACNNSTDKPTAEGGRIETGPPALHAIHDTKLRELMDKMDSLMQDRFMTETEIDSERHKYAKSIAKSADSLSKTVDTIIAQLPKLQLTPAEQSTFLALAHKLSNQANHLHDQAIQNHIDAISDSLHIINVTCTSCHALYRKTGG